jgi:histidyl-tRNA synthetase
MKSTPKGMRDFLPEEMLVRNEVFSKLEAVYRSYGYRPLETPAMEYLETLRAKAGGEVEGEIFSLDGKELALRFDLTVPLARVAATNQFPRPFKRYCISRVWRKEEPQRGRFREFWQADADIIGSASPRCEAELLGMAKSILSDFGFPKPKFMLNNRKILDALAEKLSVTGPKKAEMFRLLDKWDKLGEEAVIAEMEKAVGGKTTEQLFSYVKSAKNNDEALDLAAKISKEGADELSRIVELCEFPVSVDLSLVRGLGYYTGPVFEIKLAENMGTVIAGGRYDNLLSVYGQQDFATGISVGVERLITLMAERKKGEGPEQKTYTRVFVAAVKPEFFAYAQKVAAEFRALGIEAEIDLNERKLRQQLEYANALSIPWLAVVGEKEMKENKVALKDMVSGKDESLSVLQAAEKVAKK